MRPGDRLIVREFRVRDDVREVDADEARFVGRVRVARATVATRVTGVLFQHMLSDVDPGRRSPIAAPVPTVARRANRPRHATRSGRSQVVDPIDDARAAALVRRRRVTSELTDQLEQLATWRGTLLDLAELGLDVALTIGIERLRGHVRTVGSDVVVIDGADGHRYYARPPAIAAITADRHVTRRITGSREPTVTTGFATSLAELRDHGARVRLHINNGALTVAGRLVPLGHDVATVALDAPDAPVTIVYIDSVDWLVAFKSADK